MLREFPLPAAFRPYPVPAGDAVRADPVPVRQAATVMLVRPGPSGLEVFTFRRRSSLAFAAGMLVFPGGAVEPQDADDHLPWAGPAPSTFADALSADEGLARAIVAAAVRETFEECGVLLARCADGALLDEPLDTEPWEARRQALLAGDLDLGALLREAGLAVAADLLRPWAHWVTPVGESRRFDTRFFVAEVPAGQQARDLGGEGEQASWTEPSAVLEGHRAGRVPLLPPTLVTLEELAVAASVEALLVTQRRPRPVSPWVEQVGTGPDGAPRYAMRIDLDGVGGGEPGPAQTAGVVS